MCHRRIRDNPCFLVPHKPSSAGWICTCPLGGFPLSPGTPSPYPARQNRAYVRSGRHSVRTPVCSRHRWSWVETALSRSASRQQPARSSTWGSSASVSEYAGTGLHRVLRRQVARYANRGLYVCSTARWLAVTAPYTLEACIDTEARRPE